MVDSVLIDFQQMLEEKLAQRSDGNSLIVAYLNNRHAALGALIQLLQINLSDILLGKASTRQTDALILTFSEHNEAQNVFQKLVQEWNPEHDEGQINVQLWSQGKMEAEDILGLEAASVA